MSRPSPDALSPEQSRILDREIRVVEAGPGSGKTRAVVARYLVEARTQTHGVALLSFTNAAVDEVRRRAGGSHELLRPPHFVGTIDSFLHRFIVTPRMIVKLKRPPTYLASWDDLPDHHRGRTVRLRGIPGAGIRLRNFAPENFQIQLMTTSLNHTERAYLKAVDDLGRRSDLVEEARGSIRGYAKRGIYDSSVARAIAAVAILRPDDSDLPRRIARRFGLIIVDEAQDCDGAEMSILQELARHTTVVLIADPDQAIYEFRGGRPDLFAAYRDAQPPAASMSLSVSHRSTSAICAAVSALRRVGRQPIRSASCAPCPPIYVVVGKPDEQRVKFGGLLAQHSIATSDAVVLAHGWSTAVRIAGITATVSSMACGDTPLRAAIWEFIRPMLSPTLVALNREAFLLDDTAQTTVELAAHRGTSALDDIDLGNDQLAEGA
jgi:DNA helicase-2/ATP-dependent DNA helicase PcrA